MKTLTYLILSLVVCATVNQLHCADPKDVKTSAASAASAAASSSVVVASSYSSSAGASSSAQVAVAAAASASAGAGSLQQVAAKTGAATSQRAKSKGAEQLRALRIQIVETEERLRKENGGGLTPGQQRAFNELQDAVSDSVEDRLNDIEGCMGNIKRSISAQGKLLAFAGNIAIRAMSKGGAKLDTEENEILKTLGQLVGAVDKGSNRLVQPRERNGDSASGHASDNDDDTKPVNG